MNRLFHGKRLAIRIIHLPVVVAVLLAAAGPAGVAGSPAPQPPSAGQIVNQFQKNGGVFPGERRNHAKGVCISGYFDSSGAAARYSVAQVFVPGQRTPVIGRLSIPGTNPYAWDDATPIRGMALDFLQADGQQWRTAMNAVPVFPVATPAENYVFLKAQQPVPATGEPDPEKLAAFFAAHPKANAFRIWDQATQPAASYATVRYNGLDAFYFVDGHGHQQAVRWSMAPETPADHRAAPTDAADFLESDLRERLAHAPLRWRLVVTLAAPGDAIDDASVAWPADRPQVDAGTLVILSSQPQRIGVCRDLSFDPLVLPRGIEPSADPLLRDRAATYAESLRRRLHDPRDDVPAPASTSQP